jgi:aminodeoxyfutalosine deaminase
LKSKKHWGLAPHALFTASADLYRRCSEVAQREKTLLTTHLAESGEEVSMFRDRKGPLYEFLQGIGRVTSDLGHGTPVSRFSEIIRDSSASLGMTENWLLVHMNELEETDFDQLAGSTSKASIVHCPRSHKYFGHSLFQYDKLRASGFGLCLGTDSLASNDDLSLFAEMRAFQKEFPNVSAEEILEMVTTDPARALRQQERLGKIRPGFAADLIAVPFEGSTSLFDAIIANDRSIGWSMITGVVQAV